MAKEVLRTIVKLIIPRGMRNWLRDDIRRIAESPIPKVPLAEKHVANCELLLNRAALLAKLKNGGNVA